MGEWHELEVEGKARVTYGMAVVDAALLTVFLLTKPISFMYQVAI